MEHAIEEGGHGGGVAEQLAPVVDGTMGREERSRAFLAAHDDFQQIFGRGVRELPHPRSSMMRSGTAASSARCVLRVPASVASAISSMSVWASR